MDAFDSDVLIYAADEGNELGRRVRTLLRDPDAHPIGSVVLLPEVLSRPLREKDLRQSAALDRLLVQLDVRSADELTGDTAAQLGAKYGLRAADAIHLATAVAAGADRFITNNRKDFPKTIAEIEIVYPDDLPTGPA